MTVIISNNELNNLLEQWEREYQNNSNLPNDILRR